MKTELSTKINFSLKAPDSDFGRILVDGSKTSRQLACELIETSHVALSDVADIDVVEDLINDAFDKHTETTMQLDADFRRECFR